MTIKCKHGRLICYDCCDDLVEMHTRQRRLSETVWIAQHAAKAGEGLKVAGQNPDGTANLSRTCSVAGEDVQAGDRLLLLDPVQSTFIRDC